MIDYFDEVERELCGALARGAHRPLRFAKKERSTPARGVQAGSPRAAGSHRLPSHSPLTAPSVRSPLIPPWARSPLTAPWARSALAAPWARAALALAGAAAGAAIVLSLVGLGAGTPKAFAGWTAAPTAPTPQQLAAAEAGCVQRLHGLAKPRGLIDPSVTGWRPVIADTRGPYTMLYLEAAASHAHAMCLFGQSGAVILDSDQGFDAAEAPLSKGSEVAVTSSLVRAKVSASGAEATYTEMLGRAGRAVTGVTLELANGETVTATIADERFLAWWPGGERAVSAEVSTREGTSTQQLSGHYVLQEVRQEPPQAPGA